MDEKIDYRFSLLDGRSWFTSLENIHTFRHVPIATNDPSRRDVLSYSDQGLKYLYPWFISDCNAASHEGVIRNLLLMIPTFRQMMLRKQYPFMRLDINIYNTLMKVPFLFHLIARLIDTCASCYVSVYIANDDSE